MRILCFILFVFSFVFFGFAQDIHFSQMNSSPLLLNPSFTGNFYGNHRIMLNYRDQWSSITTPFRTISAAYDFKKSAKSYSGIGVNLFGDRAGDASLGITQLNFTAAINKPVSDKNRLAAGFLAGLVQRSIDFSKIKWGNQFDQSGYNPDIVSDELLGSETFYNLDLGIGLLWHCKYSENTSFNSGISASHFNFPGIGFYKASNDILNPKYIAHTDFKINLNKNETALCPSLIYVQQGVSKEIIAGMLLKYPINTKNIVSFGCGFRWGDALIPCLRYELTDTYIIEMSYDIQLSDLIVASNGRGAFEISFHYLMVNKLKAVGCEFK